MSSAKRDAGQVYTIEGIVASLILLSVLYFIIQSNSIITPQTESFTGMKLYERASDTLIALDWNNSSSWTTFLDWNSSISGLPPQTLKNYVSMWNGPNTALQQNMTGLDRAIVSMLPVDARYNLEFIYNNSTRLNDSMVISSGVPADNSVVATRLVTLNNADINNASGFWKNINQTRKAPELVEVKITCWYL